MAKIPIVVAFFFLELATMQQFASAQDYQGLLSAVDRIETNLKTLVAKEAATRQSEIAKLRAQLGPALPSQLQDSATLRMQSQIDSLRLIVSMLAVGAIQTHSLDPEWQRLQNDIAIIKSRLNEPSGQLASADDEGVSVASQVPRDGAALPDPPANSETSVEALAGIKMSGFVDATAFHDRNAHTSSFGLEQVELDLEKEFSRRGSVRADLEYVNDGAGGSIWTWNKDS